MQAEAFEFPPPQRTVFERACRIEWLTLAYLASVILLLAPLAGTSQVMMTLLVETSLGMIPCAVFLFAARVAYRPPDSRFRYGYHRVVSIAFLCAALALFVSGGWLLVESLLLLIRREHPTIGGTVLFGETVWLGWLILPVLLWSAVPILFLGRVKIPLAREIHDKVLFTDAEMNRDGWLTSTAAILGVLGIGIGLWWADAVAAGVISFRIVRDGFRSLKEVVVNLMDEEPKTVEGTGLHPLPGRVHDHLQQLPWVRSAAVRMRENGHVFFGEALVEVSNESDLVDKLEEATEGCLALDWRLYDFHVVPVRSISEEIAGNPKG